jgi:uncharacterized protein (DUF1778 family)
MTDISNPVTGQVNLRVSDEDRDRWKLAAERRGTTLSDFIREATSKAAGEVLDCAHPESMIKVYPWSKTCMACGKRLEG